MKLTLFAATGRIGRQILDQAVAAGHEVTAVVRNPAGLANAPVHIVQADLRVANPADLAPAIEGADAVLSGLGRRKKSDTGVVAPGTEAIVGAMKLADIRRIVVISAVPVYTTPSRGRPDPPKHDPADGFFLRTVATPLVKSLFGASYHDLAAMEDILRDSGLDWTAVRPPRLTNRRLTGRYRTARGQNVRHGRFIGRADVAHFMLAALDQPETIGQPMGIAY